ncbi:bifunctional NAD(P)H-hydrate repair enzyme [Nocardioides baekrokdamisoli]|uniref:Bifunctional NAD(P)H-hydrate repair enzyme n=1 Tax=Nocardioides baekrokdamisoli TaxID=1804624 RepID=A0A3G9IG60_9ACTN|nr:NAD(P)H-hydrate dehydratase [Nocardioides baekrokdamisoli]BBH18040.1 bifunctional NAD(P)H-hydrate repair enzyme [Nocardioides baekrokdamisoli]
MKIARRVEAIRAAEVGAIAAAPGDALMRRAAAGVARACIEQLGGAYGRRVHLVVGVGDNGGDALYAGVALARRGALVTATLVAGRAHPGALAAYVAAGGRLGLTGRPDLVVDGVVGIGGRPGLRPEAAAAFEQVAGVPIVAVDVPSGVDVDSGETPEIHVDADVTVTFGSLRHAHLVDPAAAACGAVAVVELGVDFPAGDVEALEAEDVRLLLPAPESDDHKYTRGVVGVRAGSVRYPGAAVLAVAGASVGFAGMVRYVGAAGEQVVAAHPEVVGAGKVQAWVVGSGTDADAESHLHAAGGTPIVIDADALVHLPGAAPADAVLTPHAGELATMLGVSRDEIEARPLHHVRQAAEAYDAVVLLKGRRTLIARPDGRVRVNTTGTPWLATAGSGDVLAGLIGSLLATGMSGFDAASVGAWLHGRAAQACGDGPLVAGMLPDAIRAVVEDLFA